MKLLEPILPSISSIYTVLQQSQEIRWLIGGSCGLLFHHVDIGRNPRDLDIYIDQKDVPIVHALLEPFAIDSPKYSETPIYSSTLSHYLIDGYNVEMVGDFKVSAHDSLYQVEIGYLWDNHPNPAQAQDHVVHLMPLAHELLFNMLRNRPDRYEPILSAMQADPRKHLPALSDLLQRNQWGDDFQTKLKGWLDLSR